MKIKNKPIFVYDVETFPNFFSCAVKNTESGNIRVYEISSRKNDLGLIIELFSNKKIMFCGYNTIHYDAPIISYLTLNYFDLCAKSTWDTCREIKKFSDTIINSTTSASWKKYKYANLFSNLDLLTMMFSSKLRVGLKSLQVTMDYENVEEYSGDFDKMLPMNKVDEVIAYNINDVLSTEKLLYRLKDKIQLRLDIEQTFGVNVLNMDGVNLGVEIIKHNYLKDTGKKWDEIKDLRSPCSEIALNDIFFDFIKFETPTFQIFYNELKNVILNLDEEKEKKSNDKWRKVLYVDNLEFNYSLGGLHTRNDPAIVKTDDEWTVIDSDVASLYPSAIINYGLYPRHLGEEFLNTYKQIREDRIKAKKEGNEVVNQTYKLALNGISGMLQSEYSWCYDPKTVITLRLNCQLLLLMLTEQLMLAGCKIIQVNTDGILYQARTNELDKVMEVCSKWEQLTKLQLDHEYFEAFYQYAINDYIGVYKGYSETHDSKLIKTKGLFIREPMLGKGMAPRIVAEALVEYFVNNVDPDDTLRDCTDIKKFLTFQKVSKDFYVEYGGNIIPHINRYFMSTNGHKLRKFKNDIYGKRKYSDVCATSGVTILNKLEDVDPSEAHINYNWYRNEIYKIIYPIEDSLNPTIF